MNNNRKLCFDINTDNIKIKKLLKRDFLELSMKVISDANPNNNGSWFTVESMEKALPTFKNKPILGYFNNGDFVSHNGEWKKDAETNMEYWDTLGNQGERILGLIRCEDDVKIEKNPDDGLNWITLTCALWVQYSYKQVKRLLKDALSAKKNGGPTKNVSVEIDILDGEELENGVYKINEFNLVGITILGSRNGIKVQPGIENAELSVVDMMDKEVFDKQASAIRMAYSKLEENINAEEKGGKTLMELKEENSETLAEEQKIETPVEEGVSKEVFEEKPEGEKEGNKEVKEKEPAKYEEDEIEDRETYKIPDSGILDMTWYLQNLNGSISSSEDFKKSLEEGYVDVDHKDLVLKILNRYILMMKAIRQDLIAALAELSEENLKDALELEDSLSQYEDSKCLLSHCKELAATCKELEMSCKDYEGKCGELEQECKTYKERCEKAEYANKEYEHKEYMKNVEEMLSHACLIDEENKKSLYEKCENSEINTLDELKVQIGLAMFDITSKNPVEPTTKVNATFAAPVDKTPNIVIDSAEGSKKKGNKNSWDILDDYAGK